MSDITDSPSASVVVVGFDLPFWDLVRFLVKLAFASIPAGIVIALIYGVFAVALGLLGHSLRLIPW